VKCTHSVVVVLVLFLSFSANLLAQTTVEGIDNLNKALQLRPDYDDAMAYMNLMYRERSDIQCDDSAASSADLKTADEWVDKTIATKKSKAKKAERSTKPIATNPQ
jgi:hypothetical protein